MPWRMIMDRPIALIPVEVDTGMRMTLMGGTADYEGQKVRLDVTPGCGVQVVYKDHSYYVSPENILAGIIEMVNRDERDDEPDSEMVADQQSGGQ